MIVFHCLFSLEKCRRGIACHVTELSNKHSHIIPNHTTRCQVISRSVVLTTKCSSVSLKNPVSNTEANLSRPRCLQNAMIRFLTVLTAFNKHYVSYILNFIVSTCFDICHCFANMKNVEVFSLKSFLSVLGDLSYSG